MTDDLNFVIATPRFDLRDDYVIMMPPYIGQLLEGVGKNTISPCKYECMCPNAILLDLRTGRQSGTLGLSAQVDEPNLVAISTVDGGRWIELISSGVHH